MTMVNDDIDKKLIKSLSDAQRKWILILYDAWCNEHKLHQWVSPDDCYGLRKPTIDKVHELGLTARQNVNIGYTCEDWENHVVGTVYILNDYGSDVGWFLKYCLDDEGCYDDT